MTPFNSSGGSWPNLQTRETAAETFKFGDTSFSPSICCVWASSLLLAFCHSQPDRRSTESQNSSQTLNPTPFQRTGDDCPACFLAAGVQIQSCLRAAPAAAAGAAAVAGRSHRHCRSQIPYGTQGTYVPTYLLSPTRKKNRGGGGGGAGYTHLCRYVPTCLPNILLYLVRYAEYVRTYMYLDLSRTDIRTYIPTITVNVHTNVLTAY